MAPRLEFRWLPAIKYTAVLLVYVLAGSVLIFYIEECRYNDKGTMKHKQKVFHGNITAVCLNLAVNSIEKSNDTKDIDNEFMSKCLKLLSKEELVELKGYGDCTWNGRSVRKWTKFVHNTLTTIGRFSLVSLINNIPSKFNFHSITELGNRTKDYQYRHSSLEQWQIAKESFNCRETLIYSMLGNPENL